MDGGNYIEKAGGSITETSQNDYTVYSKWNIITNAKKGINEVGADNGVTFGDAKSAPKKNSKQTNEEKKYILPLLIGYSRGYNYNNHFMSSKNADVKRIALNLPDSKSNSGMLLPNDYDTMIGVSEAKLKSNMLELMRAGTTVKNGMGSVAEDMVNHFIANSGGEYENSTLENVIGNDENFKVFVIRVMYKILIKLKSVNWDLSQIKDTPDLVRFDNVAFNTADNHNDGLTITIDGVEHVEVWITEYKPPPSINAPCYIKIKFVLYDTFGLDPDDIKKYGKRKDDSALRYITDWNDTTMQIRVQNTVGYGFNSWWLLQHYFNHKPFTTKVIRYFEGHYKHNDIYRSPVEPSKNTSNDVKYN